MNKRLLLLVLALAVFAGLYFYDRDNSNVSVISTTVISVEDRDLDAGPDTWHVTVDLLGEAIALEPLQARPDLAPGDTLCVDRVTRPNMATEYRRTTGKTTC